MALANKNKLKTMNDYEEIKAKIKEAQAVEELEAIKRSIIKRTYTDTDYRQFLSVNGSLHSRKRWFLATPEQKRWNLGLMNEKLKEKRRGGK